MANNPTLTSYTSSSQPHTTSAVQTRAEFRTFLRSFAHHNRDDTPTQATHLNTLRHDLSRLRHEMLGIVTDYHYQLSQLSADQHAREEALASHFSAQILSPSSSTSSSPHLEDEAMARQIRADVETMEASRQARQRALAKITNLKLWECENRRMKLRGEFRAALGLDGNDGADVSVKNGKVDWAWLRRFSERHSVPSDTAGSATSGTRASSGDTTGTMTTSNGTHETEDSTDSHEMAGGSVNDEPKTTGAEGATV